MPMKILKAIPFHDGNALVLSTDRNYMDYAIVAIQSWLDNASKPTNCIILTDENDWKGMQSYMESNLRIPSNSTLEVHCIADLVDLDELQLYEFGYLTKAMYYRLLIPAIMPDYGKVLYVDSDVCIANPMEEIFDTEFEGDEIIGAVEDFETMKMLPKGIKGMGCIPEELQKGLANKYGNLREWYRREMDINPDDNPKYMNSGVCLFDIKKCNEYGFTDKCFDLISKQMKANGWILYPDQDVLNSVCKGRIKWLPHRWNALWCYATKYALNIRLQRKSLQEEGEKYKESIENACLWHYLCGKPWNKPSLDYDMAMHWWKACQKTPLFEKHLSKLSKNVQAKILELLGEERKTPAIDSFF